MYVLTCLLWWATALILQVGCSFIPSVSFSHPCIPSVSCSCGLGWSRYVRTKSTCDHIMNSLTSSVLLHVVTDCYMLIRSFAVLHHVVLLNCAQWHAGDIRWQDDAAAIPNRGRGKIQAKQAQSNKVYLVHKTPGQVQGGPDLQSSAAHPSNP